MGFTCLSENFPYYTRFSRICQDASRICNCFVKYGSQPEFQPEPLAENPVMPKPLEVRKILFQNAESYVYAPVYQRFDFVPGQVVPGPCICEQMDSTLVVPQNWTIHVDGYQNILITDDEVK